MDCPDHDRLLKLETQFHEYRVSMEGRLEKLNELREQVQNDRGAFMRQDVYDVRHAQIVTKVDAVERRQSWLAGVGAMLALLSGTIGALIGHFLR